MKAIAKVWTFASSSSSEKTYQTLLYSDFSTSCDCRGWTQRCAANNQRSCRHTRSVEMGLADAEAMSFHSYGDEPIKVPVPTIPHSAIRTPHSPPRYGQRKLCL